LANEIDTIRAVEAGEEMKSATARHFNLLRGTLSTLLKARRSTSIFLVAS